MDWMNKNILIQGYTVISSQVRAVLELSCSKRPLEPLYSTALLIGYWCTGDSRYFQVKKKIIDGKNVGLPVLFYCFLNLFLHC